MSRLPVKPDSKKTGAAPLTVKVSWAALAVLIVLGLVWVVGIGLLADWFSIDVRCRGDDAYGRRARFAEAIGCALAEGPRGWLWLAWCASFPLFVTLWLQRALRRAISRAKGQRGNPAERE